MLESFSHFKIIKKLILSFVKRIRKIFISIFEMIIKGIFLNFRVKMKLSVSIKFFKYKALKRGKKWQS